MPPSPGIGTALWNAVASSAMPLALEYLRRVGVDPRPAMIAAPVGKVASNLLLICPGPRPGRPPPAMCGSFHEVEPADLPPVPADLSSQGPAP